MTNPLIEAWLDDEMDQESLFRLEAWLREDPSHQREFIYAVALQEELQASCRQHVVVTAGANRPAILDLWRRLLGNTWVPLGGLAAVLLLVASFLVQRPGTGDPSNPWVRTSPTNPAEIPVATSFQPSPAPGTKPSDDGNETQILHGDLVIESGMKQPKPTPGLKPHTKTVKSGNQGGSLRWKDAIDLDLSSHTVISLQSGEFAPVATCANAITFDSGQLRVSRKSSSQRWSAEPIQIVTRVCKIIADNGDADFSIASRSEPTGRKGIIIRVSTGPVRLLRSTGEQIVRTGETVELQDESNQAAP